VKIANRVIGRGLCPLTGDVQNTFAVINAVLTNQIKGAHMSKQTKPSIVFAHGL
jgi:hypothetical protein